MNGKSITALLLLLCVVMVAASGCLTKPESAFDIASVSSYRDIPGVTAEEINAIEALRKQGASFIYGMLPNTESFYNVDGELRGFAALFCEWLTELFGMPFIPKNYTWLALLEGLESGAIDFTGYLTATDRRRETYYMTGPISQRPAKYFRIAGSAPLSEIAKTRLPRYALVRDTATTHSVLRYASEEFIPVFIDDHIDAYELLKTGEVDAFITVGVLETGFEAFGDVVITDFFPLIFSPASFATHNSELAPFVSVMQKALDNGAIRYLNKLHNQGHLDYLRHKLSSRLTGEELKYIRDNPLIPFVAEYNNYPVSFYSVRYNEWQGIAHDVLREVELLTGLEFKIINEPGTLFDELVRILESGDALMITELIRSHDRELRFLWPETPFMTANSALISRLEHPNINSNEVYSVKVGFGRNTVHSELFRRWFPNHNNTVEYGGSGIALNALVRGEVDMVMHSTIGLLRLTHYQELPGFKANLVFDNSFISAFGFNKDAVLLRSIIDKALALVDTDRMSRDWKGRVHDYSRTIAQARAYHMTVFSVILLLVLVILVVLTINYAKKRKEVAWQRLRLQAALEDANAANRAKSDFLSTMTHEMRTPMNAVIGMTAIGKKAEDIEGKNRALNRIGDASSHLLGVINDVLDMAKIEANKLELSPVEYNFDRLLQKVMTVVSFRMDEKRQIFSVSVDNNIPRFIVGDDQRLAQVITNLLSNAVKFTPEGGKIAFTASLIEETDEACELRIEVSDSGVGISSEQQKKLFQAFEQAESGTSREYGGTGLGLAISKRIVELMGGRIWIESELGKGARFIFTVKVRRGEKNPRLVPARGVNRETFRTLVVDDVMETRDQHEDMKSAEGEFTGKRILLAEDVAINREIFIALFADTGLIIDCAEDGKEAVEMIEAAPGKYDIVFMDMQMPKMDGLEATKRIRALPSLQGVRLPIIAMTANVFKEDIEACLAAGMDGHLGKPLDNDSVLENLRKYL